LLTIETIHAAESEAEMAPVGLGQIFKLMFGDIQCSGGYFMKQGFPDMGGFGINKSDFGSAFATESFTQAGHQFETSGTTSYDDNSVFLWH
jgi:hypothetical protein